MKKQKKEEDKEDNGFLYVCVEINGFQCFYAAKHAGRLPFGMHWSLQVSGYWSSVLFHLFSQQGWFPSLLPKQTPHPRIHRTETATTSSAVPQLISILENLKRQYAHHFVISLRKWKQFVSPWIFLYWHSKCILPAIDSNKQFSLFEEESWSAHIFQKWCLECHLLKREISVWCSHLSK